MKIKNIFASIFACASLFVGCVQMEDEVVISSLDDLKVTPSYFGIPATGGDQVVKFEAKADWSVVSTPEWVTVNPMSGKASDKAVEVTVTAAAVPVSAEEGRQGEVHVKVGDKVQIITVKQDVEIPDIPFKAGKYFIVVKPDGVAKVAKPVGSSYGYLYFDDATVNGDAISGTAKHVFTFTAVEGGFTIQDSDGKYYYQKGTYDSFNLDANPVDGSVWTVKSHVAGTWKITNNAVSKWMQYDASYSSMGSYDSNRGILPLLVDASNAQEDAPVSGPKAMSIKDAVAQTDSAIVSGTVVALCTRGFILQDATDATLVYEKEYSQTFAIGDEVKAGGVPAIYNFASQIAPAAKYYEKTGSKTFTQPTPKVIDATALNALVATLDGKNKTADHLVKTEYVQMEATLSVSGTYYNLVVEGTEKQGSIYYPVSEISSKFEALNGKTVVVKGWTNGVSSNKYLNIMATSIEAK